MRLPTPKFEHPTEVYQAILQEHRANPVRMGEYLMACGWTIGDAAWAVVNWDLRTLAAAIANERAARESKRTDVSDGDLVKLRAGIDAAQRAAQPRPKKTTRIVRNAPKLTSRPPKQPEDTKT